MTPLARKEQRDMKLAFTGVAFVAVAVFAFVAIASASDNTIVLPDDDRYVGAFSSIVVDSAGRPVVSYQDFGGGGRLRLLRCGNATCTAGNTITEPEPFVDSGRDTSMVLDEDEAPVVSYSGGGRDRSLRVLRCGDPACSQDNTIAVPEVGMTGYSTSLVLDADGRPVVSYYDYENGDLSVLRCGDRAGAEGNTIASPDVEDVREFGTSLALDAEGNPVVAYCAGTKPNCGELRVLHCGDASCMAGNVIVVADNEGDVGSYPSLALDAAGHPVVSYHDVTNQDLKVLHCGDATCTKGNTVVVGDPEGGAFTSLELDAAGNPVVGYPGQDGSVNVLRCGNPGCTQDNTITVIEELGRGHVRWGVSLALDDDGRPALSYYDFESNTLHVARCDDLACKAGAQPTSPSVGGISLDSDLRPLPLETTNPDSSPWGVAVGIVSAASLLAVGGAAWYARQRS